MEHLEVKHSSRFDFHPTSLKGLFVVQRNSIKDSRGFFCRFLRGCGVVGLNKSIAQINHTSTVKKGAVRGCISSIPLMPKPSWSSCLRGEVYDGAVDIRKDSPTFLRWHGEILSADNQKSLLIPEGFAHGFQTLVDDCELIYLHSAPFHEPSEGAINAADPQIGIVWPVAITDRSSRDLHHSLITSHFKGVEI